MSSSAISPSEPLRVQPTLRTVLRPKWHTTIARLKAQKSEGSGKILILILLKLGF